MSFVKLENLNDFIQPSTSCTKPLPKKQAGVVAKVNEINLSDCLACSGCITSTETILVQQQNYDELFKVINDNKIGLIKRQIVISLSLQSISSMAARNAMSAQEAAERLSSFFISIGCHKVYDINLARHLALTESYREYKKRKTTNNLPIINSSCPGWICYAEKTNGELIIPYLSKVRSPQQIMGALVKRRYSKNVNANNVYHLTVMPCFDKKLEASRDVFACETDSSKDVDCVLTPIEIEDIMDSEGVALQDFDRRKLDCLVKTKTEFDNPLTGHIGSLSGGYAENLLLAGLNEEDRKTKGRQLAYSTLRNSDFIEVSPSHEMREHLSTQLSNTGPKFAVVNGFRNIQTVVQRLKRKALKYDYIEVMACPSGCINGGAQTKTVTPEERKRQIERASQIYKEVKPVDMSLTDFEFVKKVFDNVEDCDGDNVDQYEEKIRELFYTDFKPVPKMQNLVVSW